MARRKGQDIDGILLLDKSEGMSSNFALQQARRHLDAKKGGHTGTLDPFATGLLICCFGKATKICATMLDADKSYLATLKLGVETDSGDLTGIATKENIDIVPEIDSIMSAINKYTGQIEQIPPMHSALKKDGKPLYKYAREGIEIERSPRKVTIFNIQLIKYEYPNLILHINCSKGTYIRTLAQDIGRDLGCFAHLEALRRTSVGPFDIKNSITLGDFKDLKQPVDVLISLSELPVELVPIKTI
ncbi:tRNA pseudouridine(55) synthase TruB [Taylorella equigenitalis]|uniref:tRNA pseudouridine synthase B n=3 Tax=Taylorella equigenitalis TaxID=29575 RepID=A0A654KEZ7_TAYEM|nr:tRNA pseudouridine(55) synthase TruB [Taylorella equigenitalis]ADU90994.1 tRNA pseudouridine synthase B [Taylorella equigenitalis MCE9]AFN36100.1 tRNA pseudouridine synthase B [Taylorella equigenitalis ATCC 35865]ASY30736.1 tRNA pseudouridine(55) synthase TruB [Taylorella equigenitalis]ASY38035.1 tRNA pseudouridine(55) synthase TruB [Taylorella equigenitalis]ASY39513.1 tRNA pseudouridine(55) synthase TruB [Taylorella equigenitalis]